MPLMGGLAGGLLLGSMMDGGFGGGDFGCVRQCSNCADVEVVEALTAAAADSDELDLVCSHVHVRACLPRCCACVSYLSRCLLAVVRYLRVCFLTYRDTVI